MRLTRKEIEEKPELANLTGWLQAMQIAAKSDTPPTFKVNGPRQLPVRLRRATPPRRMIGGGRVVGSASTHRSFMGDELLRLSDVFQHVDHDKQEVLLQATFIPVNLTLATEVTSITLPFEDAVGSLDGFATWMEGISPVEKPKKISKEERIEAAREENESYGAW